MTLCTILISPDAMVGDVNLFFSMSEAGTPDYTSAEIDVMIAGALIYLLFDLSNVVMLGFKGR